ncbi:cyclic 3',5'-adenosine monophosphate phosphodiesterase [Pseudomonas sp. OF001]|uniref:3',5'-cyclic-AMP phosphodiesterase n=1 Tax=unclassified Pseudomonas TaxID=196821 RepID=UPI0019BC6A34|nr:MULTISPECIES: 3',5'-cyclic-AMP phosphodiesterase [unclassified Pseudomonas]CAD5375466.1 cyclic 3',5'-adenosine monophosphate phosphodiesterase [Pseudomonas sp. OF001]
MHSSHTHCAGAPLVLVQLTDSHLFAEEDGHLLGMDTADSLGRVVDLVLAEQPRVDLVLASGDLSQDGSLESYQRFAALTAPIDAPARWVSGNHDEPLTLQLACAGTERLAVVTDLGHWRLVVLDSSVPGSVPGQLDAAQLEQLDAALESAGERHVLLSFHHHPVAVGCSWLDPIGLRNPEALFAVTDRYPNLRCILWGHVHQEIDGQRNGVRLLASPSTCVQFAPGSEEFQVSSEAPGYRWLRLHADGSIDTGVSRVSGIDFVIDYSIKGY